MSSQVETKEAEDVKKLFSTTRKDCMEIKFLLVPSAYFNDRLGNTLATNYLVTTCHHIAKCLGTDRLLFFLEMS